MLRTIIATAGVLAITVGSALASADDRNVAADNANVLILVGVSERNVIQIVQTPNSGSRARVTIAGTGNGRSTSGSWHRPITTRAAERNPLPGTILQDGLFHSLELSVAGQSNLFSVNQTGQGHALSGFVQGISNQAMIVQTGIGQQASFRQVGTGNSLSVRQSSW